MLRPLQLAALLGMTSSLGCSTAASPPVSPEPAAVQLQLTQDGPIYTRPACPSGRWRCRALIQTDATGNPLTFAPRAGGLGADDLAQMYDLDTSLDPGVTVAIIDAFGYKNAESDLAQYRKAFGLPDCTTANGCLTIVNKEGKTSPLPSQGTGDDAGWMAETALDLDMVSAACPKCKILLVQTDNADDNALLEGHAVAAMLGAAAISDSWGGLPMDSTDSLEHFMKAANGAGIFAASGDSGLNKPDDYPSTSAYAIGVGGTDPTGSGAWSMAGSACSQSIAKPSYQPADTGCDKRAASDIAAVAQGVQVYRSGWTALSGTSVAAPLSAAIFALTGHARVQADFVYAHPEAFSDITSGPSNGSCGTALCKPGPGWDGPTGLGSPIGSKLAKIPATSPSDMGTPSDMDGDDMGSSDMGSQSDMDSQSDMATSTDMAAGHDGGSNKGDGGTGPGGPTGGCSFGPGTHATAPALLVLLLFGALLLRRRAH